MNSTTNKEKLVAAETFIRALKSKIYTHMTAVSKMCTSINLIIYLINTTKYLIE